MGHKVGIIGYGGMAGWHVKKIMKSLENCEPTAVYDIDEAKLAAAEKDGMRPFSTLDEFLGKGDFDITLVATPNNFHKPMAVAAMETGRHVIVEKPCALSSAEVSDMIEAADRNRVLFSVHQNRRWDKDFLAV